MNTETTRESNTTKSSNGRTGSAKAIKADSSGEGAPSPRKSRPYKFVYVIDEKKGSDGSDKSYWTKVGIAFENRDGSFSLELSAVPVNGRLHMREPSVRPVAEAA